MNRTSKQYAAPKWLIKAELAKFFHMIESNQKEMQKARDRAICRMMAGAGLRVQEVADLNCSDICLEERREIVTVRGGKGNKLSDCAVEWGCGREFEIVVSMARKVSD